ncbi:MAG: hypothetical protein HC923_12595 [Myxococcales bacterium]|nr:hypothetical protein [Myxococcales bacterium]
MRMFVGGLTLLMSFAASSVPTPASALSNDFRLNQTRPDGSGILFTCASGTCAPDNRGFRSFATELAFITAPRFAAPADTLGVAGFEVGVQWSGSFLSDDDHWGLTEEAGESGQRTSFLQTLQLGVRKGLPFSFEVGASMSWLVDSEMFIPGVELRWAFQEGYDFLPDFAVRGAVSHLVGNRDMSLTVLSTDVTLSKTAALGGLCRLTPFVGFGALWTAASSEIVDPTPSTLVGGQPDTPNDIVFESVDLTDEVQARAAAGIRARFSLVDVQVQGELQMFRDGELVGPVGTLSANLGLNY